MFFCEAPLTPDDEEARAWVSAELSRPDYQPTPPSALSRFFDWLIQRLVSGASKAAPVGFPIEGFFIFLLFVILAIIAVIVITHPIRLRRRMRRTAVFDSDSTLSLRDVMKCIDEARASGDLDATLIWSYRLFVLYLARDGILRDTPGLTADEAGRAAQNAFPFLTAPITSATSIFASVRYGEGHASAEDCAGMDQLIAPIHRTRSRQCTHESNSKHCRFADCSPALDANASAGHHHLFGTVICHRNSVDPPLPKRQRNPLAK